MYHTEVTAFVKCALCNAMPDANGNVKMNKLLINSNTHHSSLIENFNKLYKRNIHTDVTLVTEDHIKIQAHKIVLCAGSEFFNEFLVGASCGSSTLVFLRGVTESILVSLLEFLYLGETRVKQNCFDDFIKIANDLKISEIRGKKDEQDSEAHLNLLEPLIKTEDATIEFNENLNTVEPGKIPLGYSSFGQPVFQQEEKPSMKTTSVSARRETKYEKYESKRISTCPWCGKVMKVSSLGLHIRSLHEKIKIKCDHCPFEAKRKDTLKDHLMNAHSIGYKYICEFKECNFKTTRPSRLANHKTEFHSPINEMISETVSISAESVESSEVPDKMETSGANDKYKCGLPECAFIASNPGKLMEHKFSRHRS